MSKPATPKSTAPKPPKKVTATRIVDKGRDLAATLEANPLAALLGGLALGAAAGALLPRSEKEKALLAPLGEKLSGAAQAALDAGREAGTKALKDNELSVEGLREQVSKLVSQATDAASVAGTAALDAAKTNISK